MRKYIKNNIKVYNADSLQLMTEMAEKGVQVDCIVTDPPYLVTSRGNAGNSGGMLQKAKNKSGKVFSENNCHVSQWAPLCYNLLKDTGHTYIMTNDKNLIEYLNVLTGVGFHFIKDIIWRKDNAIMGQFYMGCKEHILFFRKGAGVKIRKCGTKDVLDFPNKKLKRMDGTNCHDTEKPIGLMQTLIENSTDEGELVLDPFVGIGATPLACMRTGRKFIGAELDTEEGYWDILVNRLEHNGDYTIE